MPMTDPKEELQHYLQRARESLLWKLDGLSEYDVRRPLVRTGTNLLGLLKHTASVEAGYLGDCFGRPFPQEFPWLADDAEPNADMWATADETREQFIDFYHRVWTHSDETIAQVDLDTLGSVPWWPAERRETTLHRILIHVIAETERHAGQADIVRELIDGATGLRANDPNVPDRDDAWWTDYRNKLEQVARDAAN